MGAGTMYNDARLPGLAAALLSRLTQPRPRPCPCTQVKNLEVVWAGMGDMVAQPQVGGAPTVPSCIACAAVQTERTPSHPACCPPQNEAAATHAAKLAREEAVLDFSQPAEVCHNKVRGFAGWPGTFATFLQTAAAGSGSGGEGSSREEAVELKIVRTRVGDAAAWSGGSEREVAASPSKDALLIRCGDGSVLQVGGLGGRGRRGGVQQGARRAGGGVQQQRARRGKPVQGS